MNILVIDSCHESLFVGIANSSFSKLHGGKRDFDRYVTPLIGDVMKMAGLSFGELDAYAVVAGPGSWTGSRVGVVSTLGLVTANPKPIIELNTLDIIGYGTDKSVALYCYGNQYYTKVNGEYKFGEIEDVNKYLTMKPYIDKKYLENLNKMVLEKFGKAEFTIPQNLTPNYIADFEPNKKR